MVHKFPKILNNSKFQCQKGDVRQVSYWGHKNIRSLYTIHHPAELRTRALPQISWYSYQSYMFLQLLGTWSCALSQSALVWILSLRFRASQFCITIIQQDPAVRSQFYFTAVLLYRFQVLSTPIIRSTSTVSTASGTGHTVWYKSI